MSPPPLPEEPSFDPGILPLAGRWPRFLARTFDVWWETLLVSAVLGGVLGHYSASFVRWTYDTSGGRFFGILCLPIALVIDALLYRTVGNTLGKALLGLRVQTVDRKRLSFLQYLDRNVSVWIRGLALGFPLFNLFTMTNQFRRLGNGQQASYDELPMFRVFARPPGWGRKIAFGCAFASVLAVMGALNVLEQRDERETGLRSTGATYAWENPVTKISAPINSRWTCSAQMDDDAQIFTFSESTDHAIVILAVEEVYGYGLANYVEVFRKSASNMRFADDGRFAETDGIPSWQASGNMVDAGTNRANVQIWQVGSAFWRTITLQVMPYAYSDPFVEDLRLALRTTTTKRRNDDVALHRPTTAERPE